MKTKLATTPISKASQIFKRLNKSMKTKLVTTPISKAWKPNWLPHQCLKHVKCQHSMIRINLKHSTKISTLISSTWNKCIDKNEKFAMFSILIIMTILLQLKHYQNIIVLNIVVRCQNVKNGKEASKVTEGKSSRMHWRR